MNLAKSIQVPTLEYVILENTATMTPTEEIMMTATHLTRGQTTLLTNNFTLYTLLFTPYTNT